MIVRWVTLANSIALIIYSLLRAITKHGIDTELCLNKKLFTLRGHENLGNDIRRL